MNELLCANLDCRLPGSHTEDCTTTGCRGCRPARAQDGSELCRHHTHRLGPDALTCSHLHAALVLVLAAHGSPGEGATDDHPGIELNTAVAQCRTEIRRHLTHWAQLIARGRDIRLPGYWRSKRLPIGVEGPLQRAWEVDDTESALGIFVQLHAPWLAEQDQAGRASRALGELARRGKRLLASDSTRIITISACPMIVEDKPCEGKIKARLRRGDSLLPEGVTCDVNPLHSWRADQMTKLGRWLGLKQGRWISTAEAVTLYDRPVGTIHRLASVHQWRRTKDGLRPVLYDARDVAYTMTQLAAAAAANAAAEAEAAAKEPTAA